MNVLAKYTEFILDLPKTVFFNLKYFGARGMFKLPVLVSRKVKFVNTGGKVKLEGNFGFAVIRLGFSDVGIFDKRYDRTIWDVRGNVVFKGGAKIGYGSKINVGSNGTLVLGDNFVITASSAVVCFSNVRFGDNCLLSWDNLFIDNDFHNVVMKDGKTIDKSKDITVGNDVWISCRCTVLKGTVIPDNCVIGSNSLLNKVYEKPNCIYAGVPAKLIKEIEKWER